MRKTSVTLETVMDELKDIKAQIKKLVMLIPEDSLKEYENSAKIRKAYLKAAKEFPPVK